MEKLTKDITNFVIAEANTINEKVRGLNFLELLKTNLIEKINPLLSAQKFPLDEIIDYEIEIKENSKKIKISINYYINSLSVSKKKINNDSLLLVFNEASNLDIYKDEKDFTSLLLYKNTGISLPKDTVINLKFNKNVLLIEIINKDTEQILTKEKKL